MNPKSLTIVAVLFLVIGAVFFGCAMFFKLQKKNENAFVKASGGTFFVFGVITLVYGILALCFRKEITKLVAEIFALLYLVIITVITLVFNMRLNKTLKSQKEQFSVEEKSESKED